MLSRAFQMLSVSACLVLISAPVPAQEGHPLVGSWHGDRGSSASDRTQGTLVMDWDGTALTGLVNPGYEHGAQQHARLNAKDWTVHFEVEVKDASGKMVRCTVD